VRRGRARVLAALAFATFAVAAGARAEIGAPRALAFPAAGPSGEPALAVDPQGNVHLAWFDRTAEERWALRVSRLEGGRWTEPRTVVEGGEFFVNWADTPVLLARGGGRLALSYPWRNGAGTYSYDVRIVQSFDDGKTWSAPVTPHRDATPTEHGFVSLVDEGAHVRAFWLDGRNTAAPGGGGGHGHGGGAMTLRTATLDARGGLAQGAEIDARVCDCCPTAAVRAGRRTLVAYRDRDAQEIRDIAIARHQGTGWSPPRPLHADRWKMPACPVNGPALDASGLHVAAAWYTEAGGMPRVSFARSSDGGNTFASPIALTDTMTLGRVDVAIRDDRAAAVSWLEHGAGAGRILVREVPARGAPARPVEIAKTSTARSSGYPRMVRSGNRLVFAWTEAAEGQVPRIRTAIADW
jgi:hypothetical protein